MTLALMALAPLLIAGVRSYLTLRQAQRGIVKVIEAMGGADQARLDADGSVNVSRRSPTVVVVGADNRGPVPARSD